MPDQDDGNTPLSEDALSRALRYDPFENEGDEDGATGAQELVDHGYERTTTEPEPTPEPEPEPTSEPAPPAAAAEPAAPAQVEPPAEPKPGDPPPPLEDLMPKQPEVSPELQQMREMLTELRSQNQLLLQQLQAQQVQNQAGQQPQQPQPEPLPYNVVIPDNLWAALDSEDPGQRRQGIAALSTGLARMVHTTMMPIIEQKFDQRLRQHQQVTEQEYNQRTELQRQQSAVEKDFYGRYPQFSAPGLRNLVFSIGSQVSQELGATQWSPQLRDLIAARVQQVISGAQPLPPSGGNGVRAPQTRMPGARPAPVGEVRTADVGQEVRDLMDLF